MNALIRKEVRQVLPSWIVAMVLATLPVWILWPGPQGMFLASPGLLVFAPFGLGVLLLSITPFGQELNWGTLSVLLSQPVSRRRLWLVRTVVLALALGFVFGAWCISNHIRVDSVIETMKTTVWRHAFNRAGEDNQFFLKLITDTRRNVSQDTLMTGGLAVLAGFAGGLWTTLLFRQVTTAFWLTCLVPLGLGLLTGKVLESFPDAGTQAGVLVVLGAYSAAGFAWATRLFLRVQDTQWTGGIVSLPQWGRAAAESGSWAARRKQKPIRVLLRKEFQAQHINLLLAVGLLLLHLAVVAFRRLGVDYLATHRSLTMTLDELPLLWLAMPLLVGSVTIAEERKLGTLDSSLCLPATRRIQFVAKLAMALGLGVLFGGMMPLVVEQLASSIGIGVRGNETGLYFLGEIRSVLFLQLFGAAGLTALAFYGSSLTRNTLQALGVGLMASVVACLVIFEAGQAGGPQEFILWSGPLVGFIGWPVMVATVGLLAYRNFGRLHPDTRTWLRNGLILLITLASVAVVTSVIYHRAWEAWLPEEPAHSAFPYIYANRKGQNWTVSPERPISTPKLQASGFRTAVVLPDGRLWLSQRQAKLRERRRVDRGDLEGIVNWYATSPLHSGFVGGSNWRDVAVTDSACFGLRADGSLWDLSKVQPAATEGYVSPRAFLGSGHWQSISAGWEHFCALKSDGTLWQWGEPWQWGERQDPLARDFSRQKVATPMQVGTDTDWTAVCDSWDLSVAVKADGSIWRWNWASKSHGQPERWLTGPCNQPVSITLNDDAVAAVCEDGTLWIGGNLTNSSYARMLGAGQTGRAGREMVQCGNDTDWKQIKLINWIEAIGIKRDGSLWKWTLNNRFPWGGWIIPPTMPSEYLDWVTACRDGRAFLALARDGSLCLWGDREHYEYPSWDGPDSSRLLMPSRIKARRVADLWR